MHVRRFGLVLLAGVLVLLQAGVAAAGEPIYVGSDVQPFFDDYLIDEFIGDVRLKLHHPIAQEIVVSTGDFDWEGSDTAYGTVFKDGDIYRMYIRTNQHNITFNIFPRIQTTESVYTYLESKDGIHWEKPFLGIVEYDGSTENNIVWKGPQFAPFKDTNPHASPEAQYKAMGGSPMFAYQSPDGLRWELMHEEPVITQGEFGSLNLAFWDEAAGVYRAYWRGRHLGMRTILTATSEDFLHWTEPKRLEYVAPDGLPAPNFELYTQNVMPYYRNPSILIAFPDVYVDQEWPEARVMDVDPAYFLNDDTYDPQQREWMHVRMHRAAAAVRSVLFMSSRDGETFFRFNEAFIRPGPEQRGGWGYYGTGALWGIVETESTQIPGYKELSIYTVERWRYGRFATIRRHTIRLDGFVSVNASYRGGEIITKPIIFEGNYMVINFSTSAQGSIQVEFLDERGQPIPNLTLEECPLIRGDHTERVVRWRDPEGGKERIDDLSRLSGRPVRIRFVLRDADLYSFQFRSR
ncbi:MAG: hypothetical protein FWJ65_10170 [Limnochordales bacterium]|jgi:hypothetical protein|nr:hypothetical protein [Bacillota bacterium]